MNEMNKYAEKAMRYDMLAQFYKYSDPQKHVSYYQKHLNAMQKWIYSMQYQAARLPQTQMEPGMSRVRVIHASPDAPAVDIYVNGKLTLQNVKYKEISDYLQLPAGQYRVDIYAAGTTNRPVLSDMYMLLPGITYTIAAAGNLSSIRLVPFVDRTFVPAGEASVKFVHLSPDAPSVDIAVKNGDVLFKDVPFLEATKNIKVAPGKVDLEVRVAGTDNVVLTVPKVQFKADTAYTIFAVGFANGTPPLEALAAIG
ncbi:DUF4397 domain-containing protein [Peribacillus frigoritolerans]|uniref:DUF4397 domain-containing protein n=1 Tax=Peribacillus frigoritolerans TaxID=450367 RepID=UPI00105A4375|nr:DUF4397 domain-containing protein [Peribacillus frigoritolerans]TDL82699.1 DUF4397 domain-containing protein [Peribacillus frigoritolerans]